MEEELSIVAKDLCTCIRVLIDILEKKPITEEEDGRLKYIEKVMDRSAEILAKK